MISPKKWWVHWLVEKQKSTFRTIAIASFPICVFDVYLAHPLSLVLSWFILSKRMWYGCDIFFPKGEVGMIVIKDNSSMCKNVCVCACACYFLKFQVHLINVRTSFAYLANRLLFTMGVLGSFFDPHFIWTVLRILFEQFVFSGGDFCCWNLERVLHFSNFHQHQ